jgi:hypothetical protein
MISLEHARNAKTVLRQRLGRPPWLRGVGIAVDAEGSHYVKLLVAKVTDEVRAAVPATIAGVPVVTEEGGEFYAQ